MNSYELVANAGEHTLLSDIGAAGLVVVLYDTTGRNVVSMGMSTSMNYTLVKFLNTVSYTVIAHSGNYTSAGIYSLTLTVFGGCASLATVSVTPTNQVVAAGSSATFTASVTGPSPLVYQWWFGTNWVSGATNTTYSITNVQAINVGGYMVVVSNPGGAVTSTPPAQLTIGSAPSGGNINPSSGVLTWTPTTGQVGTSTICVSVTDYNPWAVNTQQLSVTNSLNVTVKGLTAPSFTQTPTSQVVSAGQGFTFTSLATNFPFPMYQWQFSANGATWQNVNGATGANYQLGSSGVTNIGFYRVVIANSVNTNTSANVSLTYLNLAMYAGLNILSPIGANYNVQAIPALGGTNWTTLTNVSLPAQPYIYIDYNSPTNAKQFYWAVPRSPSAHPRMAFGSTINHPPVPAIIFFLAI